MLKRFVGSIDNIYQRDIPKVVVLKDPTKGAMSTYFHRAAYSYTHILLIGKQKLDF